MRVTVTLAVACLIGGMTIAAESSAGIKQYDLNIPRQPLDTALKDFAQQTGLQIARFSDTITGSAMVGPVSGSLTTGEALDSLLTPQGLTYKVVNDRTIAIVRAGSIGRSVALLQGGEEPATPIERYLRLANNDQSAQQSASSSTQRSSSSNRAYSKEDDSNRILDEVTVFGRGFEDKLRDIPQMATVLDRDMLSSLGAISLPDVLQFIPTASNLVSEFAPAGSNFNIRGFGTSSTWNGMSLRSINQNPDLANVERVEVLMGPSSVLYGSMEPGAVINIVTKQPRDQYHMELMAEYGRFNKKHVTLDVGGPFGARAAGRLNVSYAEEGAPFDFWKEEGLLVAPVVHFDLADATALILEGAYRSSKYPYGGYDGRRPVIGTLRPNPLGEIPLSLNPAYEPGVSHGEWISTDVSARVSHRFSDTLSLNAAVAYTRGERERLQIFPLVLAADNRTLTRNFTYDSGSESDDRSAHLDLRGELATGPMSHRYTIGIDYRDFAQENHVRVVNTTPIDVFAPVYGMLVLPNPLLAPRADVNLETKEPFVQDRIQFGSRFNLLLGFRYTDFYQTSIVTPVGGTPSTTSIIDTDAWSTQFGVVYDATDAVTLFASRNTSFVPRAALSTGQFGVDPERGMQYEAGAKMELGARALAVNVAVFYIEKPNVLTVDGTNPNLFVPLGAVESQGIELSLQGNPLPGWSLYAGYGYNETEVVAANEPGITGKEFRNAPKNSISLISRYEIQAGPLERLVLSANARYQDVRYADPANVLAFPSYTSVDLGATYPFADGMEIGVFGKNLTDEEIWSGFVANAAMPSAGRTWLARFTYSYR